MLSATLTRRGMVAAVALGGLAVGRPGFCARRARALPLPSILTPPWSGARRDAFRAQGVPVETHLFLDGGHGFGLGMARGKSVENWPVLLSGWARYRGLWS